MTSEEIKNLAHEYITGAGKPSLEDLDTVIDWLYMMWEAGAIPDGTDGICDDIASPALRVINLLHTTALAREKSLAITKIKKEYADKHGIPFSQVRINKESK